MTSAERDRVKLEVCVDDVEGLMAAIRGGADRIELCSALPIGGLTPTPGLISFAAQQQSISSVPVFAMIRPRDGDFSYSEAQLQTMEADIDAVRAAGLAGVVFGANRTDGRLDVRQLNRLVHRAEGLGNTLHRSFDLVPDLGDALNIAVQMGFERILTSGRALRAIPDGLDDIARAHQLAAGRISIMPGAGVRSENVADVLRRVPGIREVHSSCSSIVENAENGRLAELGFVSRRTSEELVRNMKAQLRTCFAD